MLPWLSLIALTGLTTYFATIPVSEQVPPRDLRRTRYGDAEFPPVGRSVPPLPYPHNALEPAISVRTVHIHHDELQAGYVRKTWETLDELAELRKGKLPVAERRQARQKLWRNLAFQGSGAVLHQLYWENMVPGGTRGPGPTLRRAIERDFDSLRQFSEEFADVALSLQGSGWVILAWAPSLQRLVLLSVDQHQRETLPGWVPLLVFDVWEHAYIIDHGPDRARYLQGFWRLINWPVVEQRLQSVVRGNAPVITKEDIHRKADELGIIWDYDKPGSGPFLKHSRRVTGKTHVDDMSQQEVVALYRSLQAMGARGRTRAQRFRSR